jgi:hypothetical protein
MTNIDRDNSSKEDKEVKKDCIQESMGLSLDNPMEESEVWDSEESFYLPVLATQHSPRIPDSKTPIVDFKRQRCMHDYSLLSNIELFPSIEAYRDITK